MTARARATASTNGGGTTAATGGGEVTTEISSEATERKSVTETFVNGEWVTAGEGDAEARSRTKTTFRIRDGGGLYIETETQNGTRTIDSVLVGDEWIATGGNGEEDGSRSWSYFYLDISGSPFTRQRQGILHGQIEATFCDTNYSTTITVGNYNDTWNATSEYDVTTDTWNLTGGTMEGAGSLTTTSKSKLIESLEHLFGHSEQVKSWTAVHTEIFTFSQGVQSGIWVTTDQNMTVTDSVDIVINNSDYQQYSEELGLYAGENSYQATGHFERKNVFNKDGLIESTQSETHNVYAYECSITSYGDIYFDNTLTLGLRLNSNGENIGTGTHQFR